MPSIWVLRPLWRLAWPMSFIAIEEAAPVHVLLADMGGGLCPPSLLFCAVWILADGAGLANQPVVQNELRGICRQSGLPQTSDLPPVSTGLRMLAQHCAPNPRTGASARASPGSALDSAVCPPQPDTLIGPGTCLEVESCHSLSRLPEMRLQPNVLQHLA